MNTEYDFMLVELTETIRKIESIPLMKRNSKQNLSLVQARIALNNLETNWQSPPFEFRKEVVE